MNDRRMEDWEASDFQRSFRKAADRSSMPEFKREIGALADALEPLDREFFRETSACGRELTEVLGDLRSIGARMGYCERDRGFGEECADVYRDAHRVVASVEAFNGGCFL